jgi:hypothetical protein
MMVRGVRWFRGLLLAACVVAAPGLHAQPVGPPPPTEYKVEIRYRIRAGRNERVPQFRALTRYLESIGFQKDPGPEDEADNPDVTTMTGTIPSANAGKILQDRHVEAILLVPAGYQVPAGDERVKVNLGLARLFTPERQRLLAEQTLMLLETQGFRPAVGYDHRGHTRLVGTIPADRLRRLLEDLRWESSGWLAPAVPVATLPLPLRNAWPVDVVEVVPEPEGIAPARELPPAPRVPPEQAYLLKIAPDLRALPDQNRVVRMEVRLTTPPSEVDFGWHQRLAAAAGGPVEGHVGPLVTVKAPAAAAQVLATLPNVIAVRLPRLAQTGPVAVDRSIPAPEALRAVGLDHYHALGQRGRGVRVAVIDDDFRGYQPFVGKRLPAKTQLLDVTAQCNADLRPSGYPDNGVTLGHGTLAALTLAAAAPEAELTLIRIDRDALYQLYAVARYLRGQPVSSECLEQRREELATDHERLDLLRARLLQERAGVLDNFKQDKETVQKREAYFQRQAELDKLSQELQAREQRYLRLVQDLLGLKGTRVVSCSLVWNDGYPVDGGSLLSRYFDGQPLQPPLWFQAVGNAGGQAWTGLFRDADGNGIMEFDAAEKSPRPGRWTTELNFLGWQPASGSVTQDLPKGRFRVTVQWREPHDPAFWNRPDDPYRVPLANLQLLVLHQRDPSGTKLATDEMEAVAGSTGLPLRLDNGPTDAMYEQTVEFTVDVPGVYAVRVQGGVPRSIRPVGAPTLPSLETIWELHPRLFVDALDSPASRAPSGASLGCVVFHDYASSLGNLGMPADARHVESMGATDLFSGPRPYSSGGPALGQELHVKPDAFSPDALDVTGEKVGGTGMSAAFAAGAAASALSARVPAEEIVRSIQAAPGGMLRLPPLPGPTR